MPASVAMTMTDFNTLTTALPPYIRQPAIREPGYLETIEYQVAFFEGVLDEPQLAALRRTLIMRNRPAEAVLKMVTILDGLNYKARERFICSLDPLYFINEFCQIYDNTQRVWIPFKLWDAQIGVLYSFETQQFVIILKARQNGLTWEALAWALFTTQFRPIATVLLFSLSDREAMALLSQERFIGMYERLPDHIKTTKIDQNNAHFLRFDNGSNVTALPSTRGDSYTATLVVVDEADLVPNLAKLMRAAKPTIEAGGQMILLSRADKDRPNSRFKRIFRNAIKPNSGSRYHPIFLPWSAHPGKDILKDGLWIACRFAVLPYVANIMFMIAAYIQHRSGSGRHRFETPHPTDAAIIVIRIDAPCCEAFEQAAQIICVRKHCGAESSDNIAATASKRRPSACFAFNDSDLFRTRI